MTPRTRKLVLTAHVTFSVGWLGSVAAFLALAIAGLTSDDSRVVQSAYIGMRLIGWFVIVPFSLMAVMSGLFQALRGSWGLFRHYWVLIKFLIAIFAIIVLLLHMMPTTQVADAAARMSLSAADLRAVRIQLVVDAVAALVVLLTASTLAVYKPRGMTAYGRRKLQSPATDVATPGARAGSGIGPPRWTRAFGIAVATLVALFVLLHVTGHGLGQH